MCWVIGMLAGGLWLLAFALIYPELRAYRNIMDEQPKKPKKEMFYLTVVYIWNGRQCTRHEEERAWSEHEARRMILDRYLRDKIQVYKIEIEQCGA